MLRAKRPGDRFSGFSRRKVRIKKPERMGRLDDAHAGQSLLFGDLLTERRHSRPVHFRPEMMFSVVAVKKPDPVVKFVVTAHALGYRFVRVAAIMSIVTV